MIEDGLSLTPLGRQDAEAWLGVKLNSANVMLDKPPTGSLPTSPNSFTGTSTVETESTILFCQTLKTFDDTLSTEDAEKLATYLTGLFLLCTFSYNSAPYLQIPLVLSFFADNRVGTLLNSDLQCLVERVLFEPGRYARFL